MRPILTQIQISIHASAKEATNSNHFALKLDNYFNPRLREGGDGKTTIISFPLEEISIHASAKEATDIQKQAEERMDISIHASAKEATRAGYQVHTVKIFQSTPPRRRRQAGGLQNRPYQDISIHASAKEATTIILPSLSVYRFQSTPPRRRRLVLFALLKFV